MRVALMTVLFALSTPALATEPVAKTSSVDAPVAQPAAQTPKGAEVSERKICRRIDASESRLGAKTVCLTEDQWKKRDQESSDY
jgi:hypothetical protein